jgi:hypothetical protein
MNSANRNVVELDRYREAKASQPSIATQGSSPQPNWESAVRDRLQYLLALPAGWDSSDAKKVDPWTAEFANTLLHYVWPVDGPPPFIAPTCYGGVQFEWHLPDLELEIEVIRRHHLEVFISDNDSESYITCKHDLTELFRAVDKFSEKYESGMNATSAA